MKVTEKTTKESNLDIGLDSLTENEEQLKKERYEEAGIRVDTLLICNNIPMV